MGVICHGLAVLEMAFALEPRYLEIIEQTHYLVATALNEQAITEL